MELAPGGGSGGPAAGSGVEGELKSLGEGAGKFDFPSTVSPIDPRLGAMKATMFYHALAPL